MNGQHHYQQRTSITICCRFKDFMNHPALRAARALEHRHWPIHIQKDLDLFGLKDIAVLADHFKCLSVMEDFSLAECQREWKALKRAASKLPFFTMPFQQFWGHMIVYYNNEIRYKNLLVLVLVVLMWVFDTSCAERGYALMNRIHDAVRNALSLEHVNDIMASILIGPDLKDFDPKDILEMWLKGPRGELSKRGRYLRGKLKRIFDDVSSGRLQGLGDMGL